MARHVAPVTGASSGTDKATAFAQSRAGACVAVNHIAGGQAVAEAVASGIEEEGGLAVARAGGVVRLASDASDDVTATTFVIEGGMMLSGFRGHG